jgi:hypothetical protein
MTKEQIAAMEAADQEFYKRCPVHTEPSNFMRGAEWAFGWQAQQPAQPVDGDMLERALAAPEDREIMRAGECRGMKEALTGFVKGRSERLMASKAKTPTLAERLEPLLKKHVLLVPMDRVSLAQELAAEAERGGKVEP